MFDFRRATVFCLGYRLLKQNDWLCQKVGEAWPPALTPSYDYGPNSSPFQCSSLFQRQDLFVMKLKYKMSCVMEADLRDAMQPLPVTQGIR